MDSIKYINVNGTTYINGTVYENLYASANGTDESIVSTGEKYIWNNKQDAISDLVTIRSGAAAGATAIQSSTKGVAGGVATLNSDGYVTDTELSTTYTGLTAGNLFGSTQTNDVFTFRPTAGIQDVESGDAPVGGGTIKKVEGNAVAWNQLVQNGNFSNGSDNWTLTNGIGFAASDNIATLTYNGEWWQRLEQAVNTITGHKYYVSVDVNASSSLLEYVFFIEDLYVPANDSYANMWHRYCGIFNSNWGATPLLYVASTQNLGTSGTAQVRNVQCIDLTLLGIDNLTTVAEVEAWLANNIGLKDYYPYNAGELIPVKDFKVKSVGLNMLDANTMLKSSDYGDVSVSGNTVTLTRHNANQCFYVYVDDTNIEKLPIGSSVHFSCNVVSKTGTTRIPDITIFYTDGTFLRVQNGGTGVISKKASAVCLYYASGEYGATVVLSELCINLSYDGDRNGEYEEYWERDTQFDITTLTGKLNGDGNSVVVFPDGMKAAGTVKEEIVRSGDVVKAIKKVGSKKLSTGNWSQAGRYNRNSPGVYYNNSNGEYIRIAATDYIWSSNYKYVLPYESVYNAGNHGLYIYVKISDLGDTTGKTDVQIAAMAAEYIGNYDLYYELETPQEYILDEDILPVQYRVDNYGTEQVLLDNETTITECSPKMTIKYGLNAANTIADLPHNYVSVEPQQLSEDEKAQARRNIEAFKAGDINNYYPGLHAGLADNLFGEAYTDDQFMFRPTADAQDVESGDAPVGGGTVKKVEGNGVSWNQLINIYHVQQALAGKTAKGLGNITYIAHHKYYFSEIGLPQGTFFQSDGSWPLSHLDGNQGKTRLSSMGSPYSNADNTPYIYNNSSESIDIDAYFICIDLTLLGIDSFTTVEQVENWLALNVGLKDYYPYNEGELIPVKEFSVKSVGFNLFDIDTMLLNATKEGEYYKAQNNATPRMELSMPFRMPNKSYNIRVTAHNVGGNSYLNLFYTDGTHDEIIVSDSNDTVYTILSNSNKMVDYMRLSYASAGTIYIKDVCINLSYDGDRDGEYEPYWDREVNLDPTKIYGKLNGAGEFVQVFPNGMKKVGTIKDTVDLANGIANVNVGLTLKGDLVSTYAYSEPQSLYPYGILGPINVVGKQGGHEYISNKYLVYTDRDLDKVLLAHPTNNSIYIVDSALIGKTAQEATEAIVDVQLMFELATPLTYTNLIYRDNGVDTPVSELKYRVDNYGTEQVLLGNDEEIVSCSPKMTIGYGINAADTIADMPHSYIANTPQQLDEDKQKVARQNINAASQDDMIRVQEQLDAINPKVDNDVYVDMGLPSGLLWAKRNIDVTQPDGFAASEYSYDASFFSWGNIDGHNPTGTTFDYDFGTGNNSEPYVSSNGAKLTGNLSLSYDAARAALGAPWRMPSVDEFQELFDNCDFIDASGNVIASTTTNKLITMNSVVGIRLKSKVNGKILFFPACGYADHLTLYSKGVDGRYDSSSSHLQDYRRMLYLVSTSVNPSNIFLKFYGLTIRPVM